jgi:acyl-CoA thioester hydrolase
MQNFENQNKTINNSIFSLNLPVRSLINCSVSFQKNYDLAGKKMTKENTVRYKPNQETMETEKGNGQVYELEFSVRDYECDLQGIVNNAVYQNYYEHARHQFLLGKKIDFAALHKQGIDLIVSRVEIDYKFSLRSGDLFKVTVVTRKEGFLRLIFEQDIFKLPENKHVSHAKVTGVALNHGRPLKLEKLEGFEDLWK